PGIVQFNPVPLSIINGECQHFVASMEQFVQQNGRVESTGKGCHTFQNPVLASRRMASIGIHVLPMRGIVAAAASSNSFTLAVFGRWGNDKRHVRRLGGRALGPPCYSTIPEKVAKSADPAQTRAD